MMESSQYEASKLSGRNRRLLYEWQKLKEGLKGRPDINWRVERTNADGLPVSYRIDYYQRSICGVTDVAHLNEEGVTNKPLYADHFVMMLDLPAKYPCVDGAPVLHFLTADNGEEMPHPWHPNIRYFGAFAGRVCINMVDTYTDLLWGVRRVAAYLRYDTYHATLEAPFPEDLQVAAWVRQQGEPNGWVRVERIEN